MNRMYFMTPHAASAPTRWLPLASLVSRRLALALPLAFAIAIAPVPGMAQASVATATTTDPAPSSAKLAGAALLQFEGHGQERGFFKYTGSGELRWAPDAGHYQAKLEITALGLRIRTWNSAGALGAQGLQPARFDDTPRGAEWTTRFLRDKNLITFSSGTPDLPLLPGTQDKLSALLQLGVLLGNPRQHYAIGAPLQFQAADAHRAELWSFVLGPSEALDLPGGSVNAIKLTKNPTPDFDQKIEVWLAPTHDYLPVRLLITEPGGNFIDLLWKKTQKID